MKNETVELPWLLIWRKLDPEICHYDVVFVPNKQAIYCVPVCYLVAAQMFGYLVHLGPIVGFSHEERYKVGIFLQVSRNIMVQYVQRFSSEY